MEIILLERVEKLGQMGDVVNVKPGFARNYLLPRRKALRATPENLEAFEKQRAELEARNETERTQSESAAHALEGTSLILIRQAGESGQLYGSVSARDIASGLAERGISVDRRQVELATPIKSLGLHEARIRLHPEVAVTIELNVAKSQDEAEMQAKQGRAVTEADRIAEAEAEAEAAEHEAGEAAIPAAEITEEQAEAFFEHPEDVARREAEESEQAAESETGGDETEGSADDDRS